jgi:hypothetical protein
MKHERTKQAKRIEWNNVSSVVVAHLFVRGCCCSETVQNTHLKPTARQTFKKVFLKARSLRSLTSKPRPTSELSISPTPFPSILILTITTLSLLNPGERNTSFDTCSTLPT